MAAIDVKLADGTSARIPIAREEDVEGEIQRFLNREGPYSAEWILIGSTSGRRVQYVRYEQIVQVSSTDA